MIVNLLITVPDVEVFESCTLAFKTIRTGFPNAEIRVTVNEALSSPLTRMPIIDQAKSIGARIWRPALAQHHAKWIEHMILEQRNESGPCVILDGDMIFWKSCEDWSFETPLAGYYVPMIWNDFAQCISFERLHTSFLWIRSADELLRTVDRAYPNAKKTSGEYCPVDPFMPRVQFIKGVPFFWDSTAALYNMIGGTHFGDQHLACFEHLNSASFFDVMYERLENKSGFELLHKHLVKHPDRLKNFWSIVTPYYREKHQQALSMLQSPAFPQLQSLAPFLR